MALPKDIGVELNLTTKQEERKCDICKKVIEPWQYLCLEHVLLKEAAYGVNDIEQSKEDFRDKAIKRLMAYVKYKMKEDHYEYPYYWGPIEWWEQENNGQRSNRDSTGE